jgi:hypothetical protein
MRAGRCECFDDRQTGDCHPVASGRYSPESLKAVFESSDVERFGWILMEV